MTYSESYRLIIGCYIVIISMEHFKSDARVFYGFVNYFLVYYTCISMEVTVKTRV